VILSAQPDLTHSRKLTRFVLYLFRQAATEGQGEYFIRLLYLSPSDLSLRTKIAIFSKTLTTIHLSIHHPNLNDDHLNRYMYSVSSDLLEIGPELTMDYLLDNPFDSWQRSSISWCPGDLVV